MSKATQYRDMSVLEIESALKEMRGRIFQTVNEKKQTKKAEKPHLLKQYKKEQARMLTILQEKQLGE